MEIETTISTKGQVVIPKSVRKRLSLKSGEEVVFDVEGDRIIIKKKQSPREFVEDFGNTPKKLKALSIKQIEKLIDEEYEVR